MYQHLMQQNNQDRNDQDYEILRKYILANHSTHQNSVNSVNSVNTDNNDLTLAVTEQQSLESDVSTFLRITDRHLFSDNLIAQEYDLNLGQSEGADYLNQIENDKTLKEFQQLVFLGSTVGRNLIYETFRNIKSNNKKILLIELVLKCGENPMQMFGIDFAKIKKIFRISEHKVENESLDNLGPLNQSLEQEQIYNNENVPTYDLSHYKKHILATHLFVKYSGDNIFDLFTTNEIAKLGGDSFVDFCYKQKYCNQYSGEIPKLEEQISYTKNIAISSISTALITFAVLLFILNFVAFNPLLFAIAPAVGFTVGGLTGKYVHNQKQKLNQSVETTDFDNFIQVYDNEINTMENEEERKREEANTEKLDVDGNEISNSYEPNKDLDDSKTRIYPGNPLKKINEQTNDDPDTGNTFHYYSGQK